MVRYDAGAYGFNHKTGARIMRAVKAGMPKFLKHCGIPSKAFVFLSICTKGKIIAER